MYKFNLTEVNNEDLKTVQDYLKNNKVSNYFFEHLAEISFEPDFYENTNNDYLLSITELSIIHYYIFLENKEFTMNILSGKDEKNIIQILENSIKEEFTTRFKNNLENSLIKDSQKVDKIKKI